MREPPFGQNYECVSLNGLVLALSVGIRDWEREPGRRQRVQVDVACYRRLSSPPKTFNDCIDYSRLHRYLTKDWPTRPHTDLLETLAYDLAAFALADPQVEGAHVRLAKLDVYPDTIVPAVEIERWR